MNKLFLCLTLFIFLGACNKEKQSLKRLNGEWEINKYKEVIYDGTTNFYEIIEASAVFESSRKNTEGLASISWKAVYGNDTTEFNFNGAFKQKALDELQLISPSDILKCKIRRQLKKDMTLEMVVNPDRKSIFYLKKK